MDKTRRERAKVLTVMLAAIFLLSSLAWILVNQDERARRDVVGRFRIRGQTGAQLISAYIKDVSRREQLFARQRLADPQPSEEAFLSLVQSFGFEAAVLLDSRGTLLKVYPQRGDLIGQNLAGQYRHLSRAVGGRPTVSDVVPSAARRRPVVAVAVPYDTPSGRRVASGAFEIGASPLDQFVNSILPYDADVYLIDRTSRIAASTVKLLPPFTLLSRHDPQLYQAFRFGSGQTYVEEGQKRVITSNRVPGTSWSVVMSVPESQLFRAINQVRWVPWVVYAGLVLASALAVVLLVRLAQREAQVEEQKATVETQLAEELRLNRALDEFAGRVAHDLRAPLGNALTATKMAQRHRRNDKMFEKWMETAQGQVRRGMDLIQGLLDLAKAAGTPLREPVDLNELVVDLAAEVQDVNVEAESLPMIEADRLSLRQALANLLENAGRYAKTNGTARVAVKAEPAEAGWTIVVEDEGPGLASGEADSVFRPFHRGSHNVPGTGLGLAIVATAAKAHGGRAWYEPRPGGGSMFKISIPATPRPSGAKSGSDA